VSKTKHLQEALAADYPATPTGIALKGIYREIAARCAGAEPGHMKEGIVIVPAEERRDDEIGRVALKHISNRYWMSDAE
jgi:hypothetical protein